MANLTQWLSDSILGARYANSITLAQKEGRIRLNVPQKQFCFAVPDSRTPEGVPIPH